MSRARQQAPRSPHRHQSTTPMLRLLTAVLVVACLVSDASAAHPNIIVFLVDDMGWQDTSVPFHTERTPLNEQFHTPAMERLAATGMTFTHAYACSVCTPSRVSLMTGQNAARHRVTNWTLNKDQAKDAEHPRLRFPDWNVNGLSPDPGIPRTVCARPLPDILQAAGYRTIHVGKAHFGANGTPGADPRNLGFDVTIGGHAAGGPGSYLGTQNFSAAFRRGDRIWDVPGLEQYHGQDIFLTEALTREANRAVDQAVTDGKPFFLYMAHYAVHLPYAADARFLKRYLDAGLEQREAMYAALIEGMDHSLGDILANVERHGLSDETIVMFTSDNGGLSAHSRGGQPHTHNRPLSSGKGSAHEGGVRVPMIVRWPGVVPPGSTCDTPVIIEDFFPTILEMAGSRDFVDSVQTIDGASIVPLLKQTPGFPAERDLIWHFPNDWGKSGPGIGASSAIRRGDWKLIYYHDPGREHRYELFNLAADVGEQRNLADVKTAIRDELAAALGRHLSNRDAQMPIEKATGQVVPLPGAKPGDPENVKPAASNHPFEAAIRAFEAADRKRMPKQGGVLFLGSSSIRLWPDLAEAFPDHTVIQRGFGGSQIADSIHFADRIVTPYKPRLIVLYAGDNDLAANKSPEQVFADYKKFATKVLRDLPETRLAFIAIKPSVQRWKLIGKIRSANKQIADYAATNDRLDFIDIVTPMLGADGRPRPELFQADGLHLNRQGYDVWNAVVEGSLANSAQK